MYDPTRHDNEALSADLLVAAAKELGVDSGRTERARALVLATTRHALPDDIDRWDARDRADLETFLDDDLEVLAWAPDGMHDAHGVQHGAHAASMGTFRAHAPYPSSCLSRYLRAYAAYARYAAQIRQEYAHVADDDYRRGRTAVLKRFLERPHLYFSLPMRARCEAAARANVTAEIAKLADGPLP